MVAPCPKFEKKYRLRMNATFKSIRLPRKKSMIFEQDYFSAYAMHWQNTQNFAQKFWKKLTEVKTKYLRFFRIKIRQKLQ